MQMKDIIKDFLIKNGFDGLLNNDLDCGCELDDLLPCDWHCGDCIPGYKTMEDGECVIVEEKPKRDNEVVCSHVNEKCESCPHGIPHEPTYVSENEKCTQVKGCKELGIEEAECKSHTNDDNYLETVVNCNE